MYLEIYRSALGFTAIPPIFHRTELHFTREITVDNSKDYEFNSTNYQLLTIEYISFSSREILLEWKIIGMVIYLNIFLEMFNNP